MTSAEGGSILRQPKAVWAVAFACVIAFMGIGLVDPILPAIAGDFHATQAQVELLFTSYFLITGVTMIVTGMVSSWIGPKRTLLTGLVLIVAFSALAGASNSIGAIVGFRAGWGLGNALFIATALAAIVGSASGGVAGAIILYEAALGLGISTGPLLGGALGGISWRGPFFGTAALMAVGFILVATLLPATPRPKRHTTLADPFRALRYRGLLTTGLTALFYNFGFFTLLAYTPFPLGLDAHGLGLVFFGWGVCVAITSVFVAPKLQHWFGTTRTLYVILALIAAVLAVMGWRTSSQPTLVVCVIVAGLFLGVNNTLVTQAVMRAAPVERGVASAAYSFVRFIGGAIAPYLAGKLAEWFDPHMPFYVGAVATVVAILVLFSGRRYLRHVDNDESAERPAAGSAAPEPALPEPEGGREQRGAVIVGYVSRLDGGALGGATITLTDQRGREVDRARASGDGSYRVSAPASGPYLLVCAADEHRPEASYVLLNDHPVRHDVVLASNGRPRRSAARREGA